MSLFLSFVFSRAGGFTAIVILLISVFGWEEISRRHALSEEKSAKAEVSEMIASAKAHQAAAQAISVQSRSDLTKAQAVVVTRYKTLVQRVGEIPEGAWRDCVVPPAWVALWNEGVQP